MAIQQRRKFRYNKLYFFKKKYRYYKRFPKKKKLIILSNKIKKLVRRKKASLFIKAKLKTRSGLIGFKRLYTLRYIRQRVDSLRIKNYLWRYKRRRKRFVWRRKYKKGFKIFYKRFVGSIKKKSIKGKKKLGHYRIISTFYKKFGLLPLMSKIIKYSRLRYILRKYRKVFKRKKRKIIFLQSGEDRQSKLLFLNIFIQSLISKGKLKLSAKIFLKVFVLLKFKYKLEFISKYLLALERIRPLINYKTMFIGGKKYRIPVLMPISKSYRMATRWLILNASSSGNNTINCLVNGLNSTIKNEGSLIKQRKEHHYASFENKTYIRFLRFLKGSF